MKRDPKDLLEEINSNTKEFLEMVKEAKTATGGKVDDDSPEPRLPRPPAGPPAVDPADPKLSGDPPAPADPVKKKPQPFWKTFLGQDE
jgi:hypothetical protein